MRANANWQINEWGFDLNFIHSDRREEKRHETNPLSLYPLLDLNLEQLKIHALSKDPSQVSGQLSSQVSLSSRSVVLRLQSAPRACGRARAARIRTPLALAPNPSPSRRRIGPDHAREIRVTLRVEVRRSFITTTVRDESQVTPQGRHR